ncbi:hypothetical protein K370107A2_05340 [Merdimmobilis hominis]
MEILQNYDRKTEESIAFPAKIRYNSDSSEEYIGEYVPLADCKKFLGG